MSLHDPFSRPRARPLFSGGLLAIAMAAPACGMTVEDRSAHPMLECSEGHCQCVAGRADCDGDEQTVCETDLMTSPEHCGDCGESCTHGTCQQGSCECNEGFGDCDGEIAGCETDLRSGSTHCGSCGRDCRGGDCLERICQPKPLYIDATYPNFLIKAEEQLYWLGGHEQAIVTAPADGSSAPVTLTTTVSEFTGLAYDQGILYALDWEEVRAFDVAAQGPWVIVASDPGTMGGFYGLVVGPERLYWGDGNEPRWLKTVPKTAVGATPEVLTEGVHSIAIDDASLYWVRSEVSIERMDLITGQMSTLVLFEGYVNGLTAHDGNVYWMESEEALYSVPRTGGVPVALAIDSALIGGSKLVFDSSGLYWAKYLDTIVHLPWSSDQPEALIDGQVGLGGTIALDDEFIYFTNKAAVMRVVKAVQQ